MGNLTPLFWQNTLPIMITILVSVGAALLTAWMSNSNMNNRLDDIIQRLGRIEQKLDVHDVKIATVEERTSPFRR